MGCDISILSYHNLNITNAETLANHLSKRFGFTIEYGYYAVSEYNTILNNNLKESFISLGLIQEKTIKKYRLVDEKFQQKKLFQKFGYTLFEMPEYWHLYNNEIPSKEQIDEEIKEFFINQYFLSDESENTDNGYMYIYDQIIQNNLHYYSRWWSFCETILTRERFDNNYFQNFRKLIMKDTLLLGGDKSFFVNDQCSHLNGVGQGSENEFTWNELEEFINSRNTLKVISISKTFLDNTYQLEINKINERNIAFFDDFKDLNESKVLKS